MLYVVQVKLIYLTSSILNSRSTHLTFKSNLSQLLIQILNYIYLK